MAVVLRETYRFFFHFLPEIRDPRTSDWFLAGAPWPLFAVLTAYYMFVFKIGPAFMKHRPAMQLNRVIQLYNLLQVVVCVYLTSQGFIKAYGPFSEANYNLFCEPVDHSNSELAIEIAAAVHIYYLIKVLDLLDTVFFVLRKKQSHVSFLHVYHHMGMTMLGYLATVFLPGGHGVMIGIINCFVHTVMYSYYFITIWNPESKQFIWWKKYITQLQILQFLILCIHNSFLLVYPNCGYPWWISLFIIPQFFFFFALFTDFYRKTYK